MPIEKTDNSTAVDNPIAPVTQTQENGNGSEITATGKWWAGIIMILLTASCCFFIIAFWPDRLPSPRENIKPLYINKLFHIQLAGIRESSDDIRERSDSTTKADLAKAPSVNLYPGLIHLNTILLLLVATAGFLGNMIYIATSFTTFVGAGKFKKSWLLWYCVKPFTAAALAIGIYFVFRGGFLNMSDDSTNINLYGVMTLSLLAGLFTDRTTLKLKEVFDVLLKPAQDRPNKLEKHDTENAGADGKDQAGAAVGGNTAGSGEIKDVNDVVSDGPDQPDNSEPFVKE
jgi:hypothetical protein